MDVVNTLKSKAQRERELLFKPPDYKLLEEQAAEQIEMLENTLYQVKQWYYVQSGRYYSDNNDLNDLASILKL